VPDLVSTFITSENPPTTWEEKLRAPFPPELIFSKPKLWCSACSNNKQAKHCAEHKREICPDCKNRISEAHVHLEYVGHADVTRRLDAVDPYWYWRPAYKHVAPEAMLAAIATGNTEILNTVIDNAGPLLDEFGGMWIDLVVHDDNGREVWTVGYGDAEGKQGPSARKELIGDAIRNAAMRRGVALDLWSKHDRLESQAREARQDSQNGRKKAGTDKGTESRPDPGEATSATNPKAQALADLAFVLASDQAKPEQLKADVYEKAKSSRWLASRVMHPVSREVVTLATVIAEAKSVCEEAERERVASTGVHQPEFKGPDA
jgi:hypothetical protein